MRTINLLLTALLVLFLISCSSTPKRIVPQADHGYVKNFTIKDYLVKMYFHDPMWYMPFVRPEIIDSESDKESLQIFREYLQSSVLFTFQVVQQEQFVKWYMIRGRKGKSKKSIFYDIYAMTTSKATIKNPSSPMVKKQYDNVSKGIDIDGMIFENMQIINTDVGRKALENDNDIMYNGSSFEIIRTEKIEALAQQFIIEDLDIKFPENDELEDEDE